MKGSIINEELLDVSQVKDIRYCPICGRSQDWGFEQTGPTEYYCIYCEVKFKIEKIYDSKER